MSLAAIRGQRRAFLRFASNAALSIETINPAVVAAQYAVRGELILRATQLKQQLLKDPAAFPFDKLVECNIGNPQALKQQPLTFNRQVLAIMVMPSLLDRPEITATFAPDALARAREYLAAIPAGVGAYSESQGFGIVRQQVADFIAARDGVPADKDSIFLTDGASKGVGFLLNIVLRNASDGILVPIPQYPLYSASLALQGAQLLGYELAEDRGWAMPIEVSSQLNLVTREALTSARFTLTEMPSPARPQELEKVLEDAISKGVVPRALVVINPGNPTGNCLPLENMQAVVRFCSKHNLVLMADEVYQENIYDRSMPFFSFKKVEPLR